MDDDSLDFTRAFEGDIESLPDGRSQFEVANGFRHGSHGIAAWAVPEWIGRYRVERVLGQGGFGCVFLAFDEQLDRPVAIKVPHPNRLLRPGDAAQYLAEARTVANLDHPHIVPVHDVGSTEEFPCYVVSKYIDGSTLAELARLRRFAPAEAAELVATVADALNYAHQQGLVHRDVKPGNILIDKSGRPYVVDFGLALREQDSQSKHQYAGTLAYMSPEQVRGEGHRVDGRSDIFSLGVVLYELLADRRPFRPDKKGQLADQITSVEPRPPRQLNDRIPRELERICLKALAKLASDRYASADNLASDLRHFLRSLSQRGSGTHTSITLADQSAPATAENERVAESDIRLIRIVPKGLRSFDEHDADFFLQLLAGPRDREGLPESIRFWKTRVEESDPDRTFSVGLIYGPSGCGKSSLVKAGLLPRLAAHVVPVYVEATAEDTEVRLIRQLARRVPEIDSNATLPEIVRQCRARGVGEGRKLLIVIDQFEQWLYAHHGGMGESLLAALRQCDGSHVQCLVLVRDDFYSTVNGFFHALEQPLVEGANFALVPLFDLQHAKKVLTAFGQAYGRIPDEPQPISTEQTEFLEKAVADLAEDGKVISVRLALFADMLQTRVWLPASLQEAERAGGIGVEFLERTFSATSAPPAHRYHERAARAVLKALLPDAGMNIKGNMRSYDELLRGSGYRDRPREFAEVIRILDGELRLITPTDPEGAVDADDQTELATDGVAVGDSPPGRDELVRHYYQLTHDYLVPSLRQWLTSKQKETPRGRAELRLAERAGLWSARREKQQLPSWWEYAMILGLTRAASWTPAEKELMREAGRHYLLAGSAAIVLAALAGVAIFEGKGRLNTDALLLSLRRAEPQQVPQILRELEPFRRWAVTRLRESQPTDAGEVDERSDFHQELALLRLEGRPRDAKRVLEYLSRTSPEQAKLLGEELKVAFPRVRPALWERLDAAKTPHEFLSIATVIAANEPRDDRWESTSKELCEQLVLLRPDEAAFWIENLRPLRSRLEPILRDTFTRLVSDVPEINDNKEVAALALQRYLDDDLPRLTKLLTEHVRHHPEFYRLLLPLQNSPARGLAAVRRNRAELANSDKPLSDRAAVGALSRGEQLANAILAELLLEDGTALREALESTPDQTMRSILIHRIGLLRIPPAAIITLIEKEPREDVKAGLIESLSGYTLALLPESLVTRIVPLIGQAWNDPHAELHAAADWLARRWGIAGKVRPPSGRRGDRSGWYANDAGHEFVPLRGVLRRDFAISSTEVTVAQFRRFNPEHVTRNEAEMSNFLDTEHLDECPVVYVSAYQAMRYCNWLTLRDGLGEEECCYEKLDDADDFGADGVRIHRMAAKAGMLGLKGYRLPELDEWRAACDIGTRRRREWSFGEVLDLLPDYAWFYANSRLNGQNRARAVGSAKPNPFGLFDMYGNVWDWASDSVNGDVLICGGCADNELVDLHKADVKAPDTKEWRVGFRLAQTLSPPLQSGARGP